MLCRQCGTEIAEKALICYKCGTATTEPTFKPPVPKAGGSWLMSLTSLLALVLIGFFAIYIGRIQTGGASRSTSWVFVAAAVGVVILRAIARRSGRGR